MMFCSGAPNSLDAAIRRSTSALPNIFLRRRRPRSYISLVSNFRSRMDFVGSFIRSNAGQLNWTGPVKPAQYLASGRFVRINRNHQESKEISEDVGGTDEAAIDPFRRFCPVGTCDATARCGRRRISDTTDQDHRSV